MKNTILSMVYLIYCEKIEDLGSDHSLLNSFLTTDQTTYYIIEASQTSAMIKDIHAVHIQND